MKRPTSQRQEPIVTGNTSTSSDAQCLNEKRASQLIGCSPALLRKLRRVGGGPPFIKVGRLVRYRLRDVEKWLDGHTR